MTQVSYHRSSNHEDMESKQMNLRSRNKQEDSPKIGRQRNNSQSKGKEKSPERELNEIETSKLSDNRTQKNDYKNAQGTHKQ